MPVAARSDQSDCREGEDAPQQDWWRPAGQKVGLLQTDLNTSQGRLKPTKPILCTITVLLQFKLHILWVMSPPALHI
ncbi:hypothetical protein CHARACLAT_016714 [Characodon lateralis]|uniref:Uncharacterized protein n=1 Tax=Characodon lateralis TaxID=208331 RepID=A0ABU7F422_9TELE|nr:hypothetical protein [Characodon lateralis]